MNDDRMEVELETKLNNQDILIIEGGPMAKNSRVVVQKMALNKIKTGKNSRISISKEELSGLMQSIKEVGLLQPIGVAKNGSSYEICYGNRRFMACSKLGFTHIPVIVHEKKKESDIDLKNLTENIQRRNISLAEAGRYITLLKTEGLSGAEIAVRLGVDKTYVAQCLSAYNEVPVKYREDLEVAIGKSQGSSKAKLNGKISVGAASKILSASKAYGLDEKQTEKMFEALKTDEKYIPEQSRKYAAAIKNGIKDFVKEVEPITYAMVQFWIRKDDLEDLRKKHVDNGHYRSLNAFFRDVLSGKKAARIPVVDKHDND